LFISRDITENKKIEEKLKNSEEVFRTLTENTPIGVYYNDFQGRFLYGNRKAEEIIGYKSEELIGKNFLKLHLLQFKDIGKAAKLLALNKLGKATGPDEFTLNRKDGSRVVVEINTEIITLGGKKVVLGMVEDITKRKRAAEAIRESEEKYRKLISEMINGFALHEIILDETGRPYDYSFLELNSAFEGLTGLNAADIVGKTALEVLPELEPFWIDTYGQVALTGKPARFEHFANPLKRYYEVLAYSPQKGQFATVFTDITARKQAEENLKESEEKYRTILESIEEGYFEVDLTGNLTFFNDPLCKISGYSQNELLGMNNREYTTPETAKKMYKLFSKIYQTGKPASIMDYEIIRKDKSIRVLEMSTSLMLGSSGEPIGFRGILRDITEKKLLESQLLQAQKMEAIGTLAGGIAHNFNNLLMSIQGNTSLMLLDTNANHPHYERLTNIEKSVQSGSKLTSQLLGYARGGSYEVKPISINHIITDTSSTFSMTRKDITLHYDLEHILSGVKADRGQIEQVILNIYVNAAEAMPHGGELLNIYVNAAEAMPHGGELFITTKNITHKDIKGKSYTIKPGNYILLTIRDTGIGMDKHTQAKVFDPFFTTKGLARGTGLGLASVYGIMKAHGGYIDVESQKGQCTTFFLYLPASKETIGEEVKTPGTIEKGKETILLVDDEEIILDVGEALLTSLGYTVLIAHGGKEAIEIVRTTLPSSPPDLVILDMIMPSMGGGETYDKLKEIHPTIKVLLSSGYSINGQATEILKRGCDGFMQKPFTMRELSKAIREVLGEG